MKMPSSTSVVTRCLVSLLALTAMGQLVGWLAAGAHPGQDQPASVHIAQPLPKPTVVCLDGYP